jgi:hypothetical protein
MSIININTQPTCGLTGCEIHAASHSIYSFDIDPDQVFNRTCNRSLVYTKRNGITDPNMVIGKDSVDFFNDYLDMALAELQLQFARWQRVEDIENPADGKIYDVDGNEVEFDPWLKDTETGAFQVSLILTRINDKTVIPALTPLATDFLIKHILEQFYGVDFGSMATMQRIVDTLNYQAKPIRLKTSPF